VDGRASYLNRLATKQVDRDFQISPPAHFKYAISDAFRVSRHPRAMRADGRCASFLKIVALFELAKQAIHIFVREP